MKRIRILRKKPQISPFMVVLFVLLVVYCFGLLFPIIWGVVASFRSQSEWMDNHYTGWIREFSFKSYIDAFQYMTINIDGDSTNAVTIWNQFGNSIAYTLVCSMAATITPCVCAYLSARYNYKFSTIIYLIVIVTMSLPIVGSLPSEFKIVSSLGLTESFFGMFILKANFLGVYFLVFYAQFKKIPQEYSEAAKIDGAGNLATMLKVIMPLATSTIITVFLLNFVMYWNDYQIPLIYLTRHPVVSVGLFQYSLFYGNNGVSENSPLAAAVIVALPILAVFIVSNKRLMTNLSTGGIKE